MLCYEIYMLCDDKFEQNVWWYAMLCYGMLCYIIANVHRRGSNISQKNGKNTKFITHLQCEHLFFKI